VWTAWSVSATVPWRSGHGPGITSSGIARYDSSSPPQPAARPDTPLRPRRCSAGRGRACARRSERSVVNVSRSATGIREVLPPAPLACGC
jgi:hypothetical protein